MLNFLLKLLTDELLDRDTLDFDEFSRRVFDIVKSKKSSSPEPKIRTQTQTRRCVPFDFGLRVGVHAL